MESSEKRMVLSHSKTFLNMKSQVNNGHQALPDNMLTVEPMIACAQVMGEEINKEIMKIPPVQGLSHPYTCPIPTGIDWKSCTQNDMKRDTGGKGCG